MMEREKIIRGVMTLLVLEKLSREDMHGYGLQSYVSETVQRRIAPGTIYVLLGSMLKRGLISVKDQYIVKNRPVKLYSITPLGIKFLTDHIEPLEIVSKLLDFLIPSIKERSQDVVRNP